MTAPWNVEISQMDDLNAEDRAELQRRLGAEASRFMGELGARSHAERASKYVAELRALRAAHPGENIYRLARPLRAKYSDLDPEILGAALRNL